MDGAAVKKRLTGNVLIVVWRQWMVMQPLVATILLVIVRHVAHSLVINPVKRCNMKAAIILFCTVATFALGVAWGMALEINKPKPPPEPVEPTVHHHLYYLDRSECERAI